MGSPHLIKIPTHADRVRAQEVFRQVRLPRVRLPGDVMGVADEHVEALKKANIPFQWISKEPTDGHGSPAV
jgi:hypothetical protein